MRTLHLILAVLTLGPLVACGGQPCDSDAKLRTTADGVDFVRTPDACFADLPDWDFDPEYVEIDGLRQAYVDEGPRDGSVVLLLHGQPSWSYLYRTMIPTLADAGYRVIAMDHLGMGRSDKPTDIEAYTFMVHYDRLEAFVEQLELTDIHLFVQDWGSLLGLRYAGLNPDRFAAIAVGNGQLALLPADVTPFPEPADPDVPNDDLEPLFAQIPAQQPPFYDGCDPILPPSDFGIWLDYALTATVFRPSEVLEALTWFDLPSEVEAAYDAPFPSRTYMAGPRTFPSHVNDLPGINEAARAGLESFDKPFLTIWGANDPGNLGQCATQDDLICTVAGAAGQAHVRLPEASHFLQDDQGVEIATRLVAWMAGEDTYVADFVPECEGGGALPITEAGTGTPCMDDAQCEGLEASACIRLEEAGFCSIEGCGAGECGASYVCCRDCSPMAAPLLPFEGSACLPEAVSDALATMAGCTCD